MFTCLTAAAETPGDFISALGCCTTGEQRRVAHGSASLRRGRGPAKAGREPRGDPPAARGGRASVWHDQDTRGRYPLPAIPNREA
jgi:hypothetical protein